MPVRVKNRSFYSGSISPASLNLETTVLSLSAETEIYFVGGYLDLTSLDIGDSILIQEYVEFDSTLKLYNSETYTDAQSIVVIRVPTRKLKTGYKITLTQTTGTLRTIPYQFDKFLTELA